MHDTGSAASATRTNRVPVDLHLLALDACADLQHRHRGITLRIEVEPHGPFLVDATVAELRRCVDNLVTNAQRFAEQHIVVRVRATASGVELRVDDDGPGLPNPAAYAQAWQASVRFHAEDGKSGSGIGLSIVRSIIEHLGGGVVAVPSPLGGAGFGFTLPHART